MKLPRKCLALAFAFGVVFGALVARCWAAETGDGLPKIGILWIADAARIAPYVQPFKDGLRELGWIDGRTVHLLERYDNGDPTQLPRLAAELVALGVNVFYVTDAAVPAASKASKTIPIVGADMFDPVLEGFTKSMARPDRNITGVSYQTVEAAAKRLQLAQELIPNLRSVGLLFDSSDSGARLEAEGLVSSARRIGVRIRKFEVGTLAELENTFTKLRKERVDALLVNPNLVIFQNRDTLVALASAIRLPVITEIQEFAEAGGVITFGPDVPSSSRRGAYFVDRILKGAKCTELPIEQPTKFNLVVNVKAARALGLTVPDSMINRATAVIK